MMQVLWTSCRYACFLLTACFISKVLIPSGMMIAKSQGSGANLHYSSRFYLFFLQINREGVLLLRGLDSRLSKDLPSDLQKLRCKVFPQKRFNLFLHEWLEFLFFFFHGWHMNLIHIICSLFNSGGISCTEVCSTNSGTWKQACREDEEQGTLPCPSSSNGERCVGENRLSSWFEPRIWWDSEQWKETAARAFNC